MRMTRSSRINCKISVVNTSIEHMDLLKHMGFFKMRHRGGKRNEFWASFDDEGTQSATSSCNYQFTRDPVTRF